MHKTEPKFSGIGTDQAHGQNNLIVKGGPIGLTENPVASHRWMVAGPETEGAQKKFIGEVKELR